MRLCFTRDAGSQVVKDDSRPFDAACKELHDTRQPRIVQEVMAKRIIDAARTGEETRRPAG